MSGITVVSVIVGVLLMIGLVVATAYVISLIGSRFFGDDPGGRDPDIRGQFLMWGNGPRYIEFLRWKRKLNRTKRKAR